MRTSRITIFALVIAVFVLAGFTALATAQSKRASPHESTTGTVDGAELSITYGRPFMRGRTIMGGLVPYNRTWCPGADEATTLTSSRALLIGDVPLPAGQHALWMLPTADEWTLIISSDVHAFHMYHNSRTDLGRVRLQKRTLTEPVEQLTFVIDRNASGAGGEIRMRWETTEVSTPFTVSEGTADVR